MPNHGNLTVALKILHVNTKDLSGGAARAAYRINCGLRKISADSRMLVMHKQGTNPAVLQPFGKRTRLMFKTKATLSQRILRFQHTSNSAFHSLNYFSSGLADWINRSDVDIVNLHWMADMLSVEEIGRINKPICWTMHDMWPFCGAEHYDELQAPGRYQQSYSSANRPEAYRGPDLDAWVWRRKRKAWASKTFYLISPSRWLASCAKKSELFSQKPCKVIHNGIDLSRFHPIDRRQSRAILGLHENRRYILFGAMFSTSDSRKGYHFLQPALKKLAELPDVARNTELLVFGSSTPASPPDFGLPVHYLGHLYDEISLALIYSAADVFVAPSMQDNLPNTLVEALACGTPSVAFNIGGMPDLIEHGSTGYLARAFSSENFAEGISQILASDAVALRKACREKAESSFRDTGIAANYLEYYQEIMSATH